MADSDFTRYLNFTEKGLDALIQESEASEVFYLYDRGGPNSAPGLALKVQPHGKQTYQLVKKIKGRMHRRVLRDRRLMSVTEAREEAVTLCKQLAKGEDPRELRRQANAANLLKRLTYRQALETFLEQSSALAEGTRKKYRDSLTTTFKALADKPLVTFTEALVRKVHEQRSQQSPSRADQDCRVLRLIWNWVQDTHQPTQGDPLFGPNPVSLALNKKGRAGMKGWNNVPRKQTVIPENRLADWFQALYALRDDRDSSPARVRSCRLLEALTLTGLRFNELAKLTWDRVDLELGILAIPAPLAKNRKPLIRPITKRLRALLDPAEERQAYLFAGRHDGKPLNNARKLQLEIKSRTGLWITPHDLRRVFSSAALRSGVPPLVLKRLLNHLTANQDVTADYQITSLDDLLEYSQTVENYLLRKAGVLESGLYDRVTRLLPELSDAELARLREALIKPPGGHAADG